jgi:hypothetical protein
VEQNYIWEFCLATTILITLGNGGGEPLSATLRLWVSTACVRVGFSPLQFSIQYIHENFLAVTIKYCLKWTLEWGRMPCSLVEVHWCFGGMYFLCRQSQRVSGASNHQEPAGKQGSTFPSKRWWTVYIASHPRR